VFSNSHASVCECMLADCTSQPNNNFLSLQRYS
jgi:hypothetical protein